MKINPFDDVFVIKTDGNYPSVPPYHPDQMFPEYPWKHVEGAINNTEINNAYSSIREYFHLSKFDEIHYGTKYWNPLGDIVESGKIVVIKPNWVFHKKHNSENILDCLITHTSLIRAIIDFVFLAVGATGQIIIADAPIQSADFKLLLERAHIPEMLDFYHSLGVNIQVLDLRQTYLEFNATPNRVNIKQNNGDPNGYVLATIDNNSTFCQLEHETDQKYRNSDYDGMITVGNHNRDKHRYILSKTALSADLIINMAKLKTHSKTGITAALKNIVGINGNKGYLPHYRLGAPSEGGDAYPVANSWLKFRINHSHKFITLPKFILQVLKPIGLFLINFTYLLSHSNKNNEIDKYFNSSGGWYGNDTAWRMVIDLNLALLYCGVDGKFRTENQRRWLSIVDGLIAGEGNGPLEPIPRRLGYIIAGFNPIRIDAVCAQLIGFDWKKIPLIRDGHIFLPESKNIELTRIYSNFNTNIINLSMLESNSLLPSDGWKNHIEL